MKLLTERELNDQKSATLTKELLRTENTQKAALQARQDLAKANADFSATMVAFNQKWMEEELAHAHRLQEMKEELQGLEARVHGERGLVDLLQDKLDKLGSKEQELKTWETRLQMREEGIIAQRNLTR